MGFSRQEYWSGLPCPPPGDLPDPGIEPAPLISPALAGRFFTTSATREACAFPNIYNWGPPNPHSWSIWRIGEGRGREDRMTEGHVRTDTRGSEKHSNTFIEIKTEVVAERGLPRWCSGKEPACRCRRHKRRGFDPWVGKIPWRRAWLPTPVFLPGESHGQRSLAGYSPWGHKELDTTEAT